MLRYRTPIMLFILGISLLLSAPMAFAQPRTVRIAAFNFYPAIFQAPNGSVQGFCTDFLNEIAKREGWDIQYVYGSWGDGLPKIKRGEVDVLTNVAYTPERAVFLDYSKTEIQTVWSELYVLDHSDLDNLRQVKGKTIGLMRGDYNAKNFKNLVDKLEISCRCVEYESFEDIFKAIAARKIDGGVVDNTFGAAKQQEYGIKPSGVIFNPFEIYFAVAKGKNQDILTTLDRYLAQWRKDEASPYHQARKHWGHGTASTIRVTSPWLFRAILLLLTVAGVGTVFIVALRVEVSRKTAELNKEVTKRTQIVEELHLTALMLEGELGERQAAQEALAVKEEHLRQALKMESIGRLAGGVAHDFNNMLSVILGAAQLSRFRLPADSPIQTNIELIIKAAERSSDITRQLLAFSRKEVVSPKSVNVNIRIAELQTVLVRLIGEDVKLNILPGPDIWTVIIDPSQLDQVLMNLSANARDAMHNGGQLTLQTANVTIGDDRSQYPLEATPGEYVQLSVSDSGQGMDRETQTHIFEPFFTTKEVGKGTGLGLSSVYGIVTQNGGFISVYSEPGNGTVFRVYIPRSLVETVMEQTAKTAPQGIGTILLVEDEEMLLWTTSKMLEEIGYTVIQAPTPARALQICRDVDTIDLVVTDVVMPVMNGKELAEKVGAIRPDLKVLFMSGYTADIVAQRGIVEGGMHYIAKPLDITRLNEKIKEVLNDLRKHP